MSLKAMLKKNSHYANLALCSFIYKNYQELWSLSSHYHYFTFFVAFSFLPLCFKDIFGGTYILIALHWFVCKPPESHCIKVIAMLWLNHHSNIFYLAVINFDIKKLKNNPAHFPLSKLGALEPNASY